MGRVPAALRDLTGLSSGTSVDGLMGKQKEVMYQLFIRVKVYVITWRAVRATRN